MLDLTPYLISLFMTKRGRKIYLFTFNWYLLIYFFQLVSMKIYIGVLKFDLLDVTPLLILCFEQIGGEEFVGFVFYFNPFVDD